MSVLRNIEVSKKYNVNPTTVTNWINQSLKGKVNLDLAKISDRYYIKDNYSNHNELAKLKDVGVKYRASTKVTRVKPSKKIYQLFTSDQLIDIIVNMQTFGYIPMKYLYFGTGAIVYEKMYQDSLLEKNTWPNSELELIASNVGFVTQKLKSYDSINLIDIGSTTGLPAKSVLLGLKQTGQLGDYSTIDSGCELFKICKQNVKQWLNIDAQYIQADFENSFIRSEIFLSSKNRESSNLLLFMGNRISGFRNRNLAFSHIAKSMNKNDFLWMGLAMASSPQHLDKTYIQGGSDLNKFSESIIELLNLTDHVFISDFEFDVQSKTFKKYFTPKNEIEIEFEINGQTAIVTLDKDRDVDVFVDYKYDLPEITQDILDQELAIDYFCCNSDSGYGLFLVRPKS
ncbi:MAG: hypothetical protein OHK0017_12130 [Patescibacteria group bacterium]